MFPSEIRMAYTIFACELHNIQGKKWYYMNTICNDVNWSKQKQTQYQQQKQISNMRWLSTEIIF